MTDSMMVHRGQLEALLRLIAEAAREHRHLPEVLSASGLPGSPALARRLETGETLSEALGGVLNAAEKILLAGPRPGLAESALHLADDRVRARNRRERTLTAILPPVLTAIGLVIICGAVLIYRREVPDLHWLAASIAVLVLGLLPVIVAWGGGSAHRQPRSWLDHLARADRYQRAALAAQWRLTEAELVPLLGRDLTDLAPFLASDRATFHLSRLAAWHLAAADRAHDRQGRWLGFAVLLAGAALLIATACGPIGETLAAVQSVLDHLGQ